MNNLSKIYAWLLIGQAYIAIRKGNNPSITGTAGYMPSSSIERGVTGWEIPSGPVRIPGRPRTMLRFR